MTTRWVRPAAVLWRRTLDGMLVRTPAGETVGLSATAAALVRLLDTPRTADEVAEALAEATSAPADAVRSQVGAALEDLERRGVVEACP